jgi:NADH dehydrogenase
MSTLIVRRENQKELQTSFSHPKKADGKKIVLILGAGFAGLNGAKVLSGRTDIHIILADRRNHHLFQPLLYQVATAGLNSGQFRSFFAWA